MVPIKFLFGLKAFNRSVKNSYKINSYGILKTFWIYPKLNNKRGINENFVSIYCNGRIFNDLRG